MYKLAIQKTPSGKFAICFFSQVNGKLILKGEPINRRIDALTVATAISIQMEVSPPTEVLPASHVWPKNAGPKKKVVKKK